MPGRSRTTGGRGYAGIRTKIVDHVVDNVFLQPGERRTIYFIRSNIGPLGFPPREALADSKANGSQKDIAKTAGVSHPHVAKVRSDLEKSGDVETVTASIARAKEAA